MRRRRALVCLAAAGLAWAAGDGEEAVWRDYLEWYRRRPVSESDTRRSYLDEWRRRGAPEAELRRRAAVIDRFSRERRAELQRYFFDRTYADGTPRYQTAPNSLLVDAVRDLAPGRALDIHMGQGRNAIYLASRGWRVTGFDFSAEGVRAAREAAHRAGVDLNALVQTHEEFDFGRARWDLVVMSYTWVPLRSPFVDRILDSLAPAGLLVFEHLMDESGSPNAAPWLPTPNSLLRTFSALRILRYEDVRTQPDWSWRPERIARLVAMK